MNRGRESGAGGRGWGLLLALLALLTACSKKEEAEKEAPAPVQVTTVTQDTVRRIVGGDGVLYPLNQENGMPKIQAPVKKFHANRGDHEKAEQLLDELENRDLTATLAQNKEQLDQAEANLRSTTQSTIPEAEVKARTDVQSAQQQYEAARKLLESRENLFKQGALARRQVDEAQVQLAQAKAALDSAQEHLRALNGAGRREQIATAQAQVEAARAQAQSAEAQLAYSEIRSPISGVIADRPIYPGDMAQPGQPLFIVMDISRVVARVNVPQGEANRVRVGQPAEVLLTGAAQPEQGRVTVVSPATDPNTTTVQVWVEIQNPGEQLKPGASVHAKILVEIYKAAPVVPAAAILPGEEGGTAVLVVTGDSIAHRRLVQVGVREGDKVQILGGANPGEEVVISGGLGVDDKAKVRIVDTSVKETEEEEGSPEGAKGGKDEKKGEAKPKEK